MQNADDTAGQGALVPLGEARIGVAARPRPLAGFITQLLACYGDAPAYRARRRAEPEVAAARYGAGEVNPVQSHFERWL